MSTKIPWTRGEDMALISMIGLKTHHEISSYFERSYNSIYARARRLGYSLNQGTYALNELAKKTGYDQKQLLRARRALHQQWRRCKHRYMISDDQAIALIDYLRKESTK